MPPQGHSVIGASSASRWIACPASVRMSKGKSYTSSIYADEGTAAHELGEFCLRNGCLPESRRGHIYRINGRAYEVNDDMIEAVNVYVNTVRGMVANMPLNIEAEFNLDWLHSGMFGTNDCSAYDEIANTLYVFDYKHGRKPVKVEDNPQLKYYALGVLGKDPGFCEAVVLTIVQPRCEAIGVQSWGMSTKDLYKWAYEVLKPAAELALSDNAPFNPGETQCFWCKGKVDCPALLKKSYEMVNEFFDAEEEIPAVKTITFPNPRELSAEDFQKVLDFQPVLVDYLEAVRKQAYQNALNGEIIPGYKLVRKSTHRKWIDEEAVEKDFIEVMGDKMFKKTLASPSDIEKVLGKGAVDAYTFKPEGDFVLVQESDKRKGIAMDDRKNIFIDL